jgi:uncharacterized protein (TIGR02444 family)
MDTGAGAFWQFSLRYYRRPEVSALCLQWQDEFGVDVNLLFFICFLAIHGRRLTPGEVRHIDAHIADWRKRAVQPLRALRRALKGGIAPVDPQAAESLRGAIKRDELQAERLQQEALERAFPAASTGNPSEPRAAAAANIAAYSSLTGALPQTAVDTLLTALFEEFSV